MSNQSSLFGWLIGLAAFVWWGLAPIYFKAIAHVSAAEILAHRIAWSIPVTLMVMALLKKKVALKLIFSDRKLLRLLILSTLLISVNWFVFTWAVTNGKILATSLGYFINPIMSILMGVVILSEKLNRFQWAAVGFVILGVANQIFVYGEIPWIALSLATSFAIYGFIKKQLKVDALNGFLMETTLALPFSGGYIIWSLVSAQGAFLNLDLTTDGLLLLGGIITTIPLVMFATAAKKIPLSGMGFLQFIAPTITFFLATLVYHEPLNSQQLLSFIFIWIGLALYLSNTIHRRATRTDS
ncbi:MAG: EamA family transporter RarD [Enterobacterales bacterium]|nr:EamA family transporter RarD [Enterobacterales bacterium]